MKRVERRLRLWGDRRAHTTDRRRANLGRGPGEIDRRKNPGDRRKFLGDRRSKGKSHLSRYDSIYELNGDE